MSTSMQLGAKRRSFPSNSLNNYHMLSNNAVFPSMDEQKDEWTHFHTKHQSSN
jgi:hypothetical protein